MGSSQGLALGKGEAPMGTCLSGMVSQTVFKTTPGRRVGDCAAGLPGLGGMQACCWGMGGNGGNWGTGGGVGWTWAGESPRTERARPVPFSEACRASTWRPAAP